MLSIMNFRRPHSLTAWLQILLTGLALLYAQTVGAAELRGRVVGITDGDTLTLLSVRREEIRIRLSDIDTPERGQPYGDRARQSLSDLAFGRDARIEVRDTDRYGRTVGRVFVGAVDVNAELVRRGSAWVFRRYSMIRRCSA